MIHVIIGTKAQLIKMAPIMVEMQKRGVNYNFIYTCQHREDIYKLINEFGLKNPDYELDSPDIIEVFKGIIWTLKLMSKFSLSGGGMFKGQKGIVLVHGDTASTFLGALLSKLANQRVAHIEAGLRSHKIFEPFPEELMRTLTTYLSDYYFVPNEDAVKNLQGKGGIIVDTKVNTLFDSLRLAIKSVDVEANIPKRKYVLVSVHRFENIFDKDRLRTIVKIVKIFSDKYHVVFVLHKPTERQLKRFGLYNLLKDDKNISLRGRCNYSTFIRLIDKSEFLATDGGSNQEECYYLGHPCLLLRNTSERMEGLEKNVVISKFDEGTIKKFLDEYMEYRSPPPKIRTAPSAIIVDSLIKLDQHNG